MGQVCCRAEDSMEKSPLFTFYISKDGIEILHINFQTRQTRRIYTYSKLISHSAKYCVFPTGQLFVTGGRGEVDYTRSGSVFQSSKSTVLFDAESEVFDRKENMKTGREGHAMVAENQAVYAISGLSNRRGTLSCERFDILSEEWEDIESLPEPRIDSSACVLKQRIYLTGGSMETPVYMKVLFFYIPIGQWTTADVMLPVELRHHGSSEYDGGVLIFGGICADGGPNFDTFWVSTKENRVLQKSALPASGKFASPCIYTGNTVYACETEVGRKIFIFKEDQWTTEKIFTGFNEKRK